MVRNRMTLAMKVLIALVVVASAGPLAAQAPDRKPIIPQTPLLKEPKTPEEMFAAAVLMVDLARPELALQYLEQFDATSPDDEMLIKLRDKHGTADFLKLSFAKELQPLSTILLERLNAATKRQAEDPAYVDGLLEQLTQTPAKRDRAIVELRNAGAKVVPEIIKQMSRPDLSDQQDLYVILLTRMGNQVVQPLIGALDSPQERIRAAVIDALGWLDAHEAVPYLWYPAFDENQPKGVRVAARRVLAKFLKGSPERASQVSSVDASNELRRLARQLYRKPGTLPVDEQGAVALWGWSEVDGTIAQRSLTPEVASLYLSTRFARQALALSPEQPDQQRQYLASLLGLEVLRDGWDKPRIPHPGSAMYLALTSGEAMVAGVLAEALEAGHPSTAVAALEVLSQIGSREQLLPLKGLKSPVIAAVNSPDERVQFAAATTILKLEPKTGFNGANRIVGILARAITDPGQARAIVIDSDGQRASTTAAFMTSAGYEGLVAATGREGFETAAKSAGVEVIVVHVNCIRWDLTQTLSNLRADARTAAIPVVIYGPPELRSELARLVSRNSPATYVVQSASATDFLDQALPFVKNQKTPPPSPQERGLMKSTAAYWLATIASSGLGRIFDVSQAEKELSATLEDPEIAVNAAIAMAGVGNAAAQTRLTEIAVNPQLPEPMRITAANQLTFHIQRFGLLLTRDQVVDLHEGWKSTDNPNVKSVLAGVIGSLKPNATIVGERLQNFKAPTAN